MNLFYRLAYRFDEAISSGGREIPTISFRICKLHLHSLAIHDGRKSHDATRLGSLQIVDILQVEPKGRYLLQSDFHDYSWAFHI